MTLTLKRSVSWRPAVFPLAFPSATETSEVRFACYSDHLRYESTEVNLLDGADMMVTSACTSDGALSRRDGSLCARVMGVATCRGVCHVPEYTCVSRVGCMSAARL